MPQAVMEINGQKQKIRFAVAARIRQLRHTRACSQEALALQADLNPAYVGQIERGLKCPTIDTLCRIADALGVPVTALLSSAPPSEHAEACAQRIRSLLADVPEDKLEQVLQIMEQVVGLL